MNAWTWESVPDAAAKEIAERIGEVVKAETVTGGLMPGLAAVLHSEYGKRWFVKAAPLGSPASGLHERERAANLALPDGVPAPRMRYSSGDDDWTVMLFDYLDGARDADLSPGSPDLPGVLAALEAVGSAPAWDGMTPVAVNVAPLQAKAAKMLARLPGNLRDRYAAAIDGFDIADLAGSRLVHYDLHPGNLLVTGHGMVHAVDWAFASAGASWVDAALLVPRLIDAGHAPDGAELVVSGLSGWGAAPSRAVTGLAALWTMFREYKALYGPGEAREFRARAADAGQAWVRHRLG